MTDLQIKLLNMLDDFHKICIENNLSYYVVGGTALGAIRHKGFIPWDDDIDVGMPRDDYERLKDLSKTLSLPKYEFEFSGKKDFTYTYGKMYDTTTTLIENNRYKICRGIFIDIFPIDGIGNDYKEGLKHFRRVKKIKNLIGAKTCGIRKGRKFHKNFSIIIMHLIPERILGTNKLMQRFEELCKKNNYNDCDYVANLSGAWGTKEIIKKEWLGKPLESDFQNIKVMCPEKYDEYLTAVYGDWNKLPPKEKQKTHHDYLYIDLNHSYKVQRKSTPNLI